VRGARGYAANGVGKGAATFVTAVLLGFGLSSCQTESSTTTAGVAASQIPPTISADALVGRWGLASYHNDADRARTITAARSQCGQPYVISKGQSGGIVMLLADDPKPQEVFLKGAPGGKNFVGPAGPPGDAQDREIVSLDNGIVVMRWVDPEVAGRYGTMVLSRCVKA
jgi:hypothetical protein